MGSLNNNGSRITQSRKSTKSIGSAFVFNVDRQEVETLLDGRVLPSGGISVNDGQISSVQLGSLTKSQTSVMDTGVVRNFEGTSFTPVAGDLTFVEIRNDGGTGGTIIINSGTTTIVSSGTTIVSGAVTNIYGDTTVVSGSVTNIYGDTTVVSGTTTNIYGGTTIVSGSTTVNIGTVNSGSINFSTFDTSQWEITPEGNFESQQPGNYITTFRRVVDHPENQVQLTAADSWTVITNNGTGADGFTLPPASGGMEFTFILTEAATVTISPYWGGQGEAIRVSNAALGHTSISATGVGASITLLCAYGTSTTAAAPSTSGLWVATSMMGNWTTNG